MEGGKTPLNRSITARSKYTRQAPMKENRYRLEALAEANREAQHLEAYVRPFERLSMALRNADALTEYEQCRIFLRGLPDEIHEKLFDHYFDEGIAAETWLRNWDKIYSFVSDQIDLLADVKKIGPSKPSDEELKLYAENVLAQEKSRIDRRDAGSSFLAGLPIVAQSGLSARRVTTDVTLTIFANGGSRRNRKVYDQGAAIATVADLSGRILEKRNMGVLEGPPTAPRAELTAFILAFELVIDWACTCSHFTIYSYSEYAVSCLTKSYKTWQQNGWVTAKGKPVANQDLLQEALRLRAIIDEKQLRVGVTHIPQAEDGMADRLSDEFQGLQVGYVS